MITKKVVVFYEVPEGRNVIAHFQMVLEENGKELSRTNPHTVNFMVDSDAETMLKENGAYLQNNQDFLWPAMPDEIIQNTLRLVESQHTPETKAAFEAFKAARAGK